MKELWNKEQEIKFFTEARKFAVPEKLFYLGDDNRYYAYWPKTYKGPKTTQQARNAFIGNYTERWSADLLSEFAKSKGCHALQNVICDELGLVKKSPADVAVCRTSNVIQKPEDILLIVEVKMSIVWNWELKIESSGERLVCLGDYRTHKGNPGLLRSDTMLKAAGKSINIRVADPRGSIIPIIVLGNTPITEYYHWKADYLHKSGVIQGFWSVNPSPLEKDGGNVKVTEGSGFCRVDTYEELLSKLEEVIGKETEFFSSMKPKDELGRLIEIASREATYEAKAEKFLALLRG